MQDRQLSLREATPDDEPFLLELYASTRLEELQPFGWDDNQKQAFIKMQFAVRERSYAGGENRIILLNGRPVGRILVDRSEATILLRDIALLPEYRNARVGSRLIQDLMNEANSAGTAIRLHVVASSPAVRLYERLGFRRSGDEGAYLQMMWVPADRLTRE